jgi:hypothetical protein
METVSLRNAPLANLAEELPSDPLAPLGMPSELLPRLLARLTGVPDCRGQPASSSKHWMLTHGKSFVLISYCCRVAGQWNTLEFFC